MRQVWAGLGMWMVGAAVLVWGLSWSGLGVRAQEAPIDPYASVLQDQSADAFEAFQTATAGQPYTFDPTLTVKGGRITVQIDQQIAASATLTEAEWGAYLRSQWPIAMGKVAQRLRDCHCTILGLRGGANLTTTQRTFGCCRGVTFRFTRTATKITAHIDVLAGV